MAASPEWKVFTATGEYEACAKSPETAASIVSFLGTGAKIKVLGKVVWTEVKDGIAQESYDQTAQVCYQRKRQIQVDAYETACATRTN